MAGVRDITQLCFSLNLAGIVANKIEQSFYSVYSYEFRNRVNRTCPKRNDFLIWMRICYANGAVYINIGIKLCCHGTESVHCGSGFQTV